MRKNKKIIEKNRPEVVDRMELSGAETLDSFRNADSTIEDELIYWFLLHAIIHFY